VRGFLGKAPRSLVARSTKHKCPVDDARAQQAAMRVPCTMCFGKASGSGPVICYYLLYNIMYYVLSAIRYIEKGGERSGTIELRQIASFCV
jgi:hypothetical protein